MNYRFSELARKIAMSLCLAALVGGFTACHDDYDLDAPGTTRVGWARASMTS